MRKRMFWSRPNENGTLIKDNRRSIFKNHKLEKCCESDIFSDETTYKSSEFYNESDEFHNYKIVLTYHFKFIPNGTEGNCLCHTLNNIVLEDNWQQKA